MSAKSRRVWSYLVKVCWGWGKTYFSFLFKIRACEQSCLFWDVLIRNGQPRQPVALVDGGSRGHQIRIYDCNHLTQGSPVLVFRDHSHAQTAGFKVLGSCGLASAWWSSRDAGPLLWYHLLCPLCCFTDCTCVIHL